MRSPAGQLQRLLVIEHVEDTRRRQTTSPRDRNPDAQVGDFIADQLPPMDFSRIAARSAKQVIVQKVRQKPSVTASMTNTRIALVRSSTAPSARQAMAM